MKNFVTAEWLYTHINNKDLIIVDCRADLIDKEYGKKKYLEGHIKNAHFIDLKRELVGKVKEHGGRSPLPNLQAAKRSLESIGISNHSMIIAYDEVELAGAERFWWFLRYIGHKNIFVLNGGINSWIKKGYDITTEIPKKSIGQLKFKLNNKMLCDVKYIRKKIQDKKTIIIDSRSPERYNGINEPIDKIAGHIPNAKNHFWKNNLNTDNEFKNKEELKNSFNNLKIYNEIILYCGSGIDACGNFIALNEAGFNPKLYLGSWSDWITYKENVVVTEPTLT